VSEYDNINPVKFGELIGTVGALVAVVADTKSTMIAALNEQRREMAQYRDDCRDAMEKHKEDDAKQHEILESLSKPIADMHDQIFGDGSKDGAPGLKADVYDLKTGKIKVMAWAGGFAACISIVVALLGWAVEAHYVR